MAETNLDRLCDKDQTTYYAASLEARRKPGIVQRTRTAEEVTAIRAETAHAALEYAERWAASARDLDDE